MQIFSYIARLAPNKSPWAIVSASAFALLLAALYFQHALGHEPCVKCIYQRSAVIAIFFGALLPAIHAHFIVRSLGLIIWGTAAIWGLVQANLHLEVIFPQGFFVPPCPFVPEFPSFMPLHEWLPMIFDAPGSCNTNDWQLLSMGMAEWMKVIFSCYIAAWVIALVAHVLSINLSVKAAK